MKLFQRYALLIVFLIGIIIFKLGIYQHNTIQINTLSIHKPFAYRFTSTPVNGNTKYGLLKDYLGLNSIFELKDGDSLFFTLEYIFFKKNIGFMIDKKENNFKLFMLGFQNNLESLQHEKKCFYKLQITKDYTEIYGIIKNEDMIFTITGPDKDVIYALKDNICK